MNRRCPTCDRAPGEPKDRADHSVCEHYHLASNGLTSDFTRAECNDHRVDWRARALDAERMLVTVRKELAATRRTLGRRHGAQVDK